jgi:hypothetical protein
MITARTGREDDVGEDREEDDEGESRERGDEEDEDDGGDSDASAALSSASRPS